MHQQRTRAIASRAGAGAARVPMLRLVCALAMVLAALAALPGQARSAPPLPNCSAGDFDGDGVADPLDVDQDNDGIPDISEAADDTDLDLLPGYCDSDSDGDGLSDLLEAGGVDADGDGLVDGFTDADGDGLDDALAGAPLPRPDTDGDLVRDFLDTDSDDDGVSDGDEVAAGTDPLSSDSDGDGLEDGFEIWRGDPAVYDPDLDTDPLDDDTDDDGLLDGNEDANGNGVVDMVLGGTGTAGAGETDPRLRDTDGDGIQDGTELGLLVAQGVGTDLQVFIPDNGPGQTTDPRDTDTDDGGMSDGVEDISHDGEWDFNETDPTNPDDDDPDRDFATNAAEDFAGTDPFDADSDDDGVLDGQELGGLGVVAPYGPTNPLIADTDSDGILDGTELGVVAFIPDGASSTGVPIAGTDLAAGHFRADADPGTETDPNDDDTDDDGLSDGFEDANRDGATVHTLGGTGTDGAGETDPNLADTDGDGIQDGTESGLWAPQPGLATDPAVFQPDADPATVTEPLDTDSDDGGFPDGMEDPNGNGLTEVGETDPTDPSDDDRDLDGLNGAEEAALGTDPADADTDDDGLSDGEEAKGTGPLAPFGATNPLNPDSDADGVFDGTEAGVLFPIPFGFGALGLDYVGTNVANGFFVADADFTTQTDPSDADTDAGGIPDGTEDINGNGRVDPDEGDPLDPADDDRDGDGLPDSVEATLGTDPLDPDTDGDGLSDGAEIAGNLPYVLDPGVDTDPLDRDTDDDGLGDGTEVGGFGPLVPYGPTDPLLWDTDGDTLPDGLEVGRVDPLNAGTNARGYGYGGTDPAQGHFVSDKDPTTTTDPTSADTDGDGLADNAEDANADGRVQNTIGGTGTPGAGETDPNDEDTDGDGLGDGEELGFFEPTSPLDTDSDDGSVDDGREVDAGNDPMDPADDLYLEDADGDGLSDGDELDIGTDRDDPDTDDDGLSDLRETELGTDPLDYDTDGDGLADQAELAGGDLPDTEEAGVDTDPLDADTDDDGLSDGDEVLGTGPLEAYGPSDPLDVDTDGDGLNDGLEAGLIQPIPPGVSDEGGIPFAGTMVAAGHWDADADPETTTDPSSADTDGDGIDDGDEDEDGDGAVLNVIGGTNTVGSGETDPNNPDTDGDGLTDGYEVEREPATSPLDSDSDDGGIDDGTEELNGLNPLNGGDDHILVDRDGDGLSNELEEEIGTDPDKPDTDGDGLRDGNEVALSTDPLSRDTDEDGLNDGEEIAQGGPTIYNPGLDTNPRDRDTDDDGISDADELWGAGTCSEYGATNPTHHDTDEDGLPDGLECGVVAGLVGGTSLGGAQFSGTDPAAGHFIADTDPATTTDPLSPDSDGDGLTDRQEDADRNGHAGYTIGGTGTHGSGETDPNVADTDGDGLSDGAEVGGTPATDPLDTDTDDGSIDDQTEVLGGTDPLDPSDDLDLVDSDGDGLSDRVEILLGTDRFAADTDGDGLTDAEEIAAKDPNAYEPPSDTDPRLWDTDGDTVDDKTELEGGSDPHDPNDVPLLVDWHVFQGSDCSAGGGGNAAALAIALILLLVLVNRRGARGGCRAVGLFTALLLALAPAARAAAPPKFQLETFEPLPVQGTNMLNTASNDVLPRWSPSVGLLFHYQSNPLTLADLDESDTVYSRPVAGQLKGELWAAVGILDFAEIGLILPLVPYQFGDDMAAFGEPNRNVEGFSVGDLRLVAKLAYADRRVLDGFGFGIALPISFPTGDPQRFATDGMVRFDPRIVIDWKHRDGYHISLNGGYLFRPTTRIHNYVTDDYVRVGLGVRAPIPVAPRVELAAIGSIFGAYQVNTDRLPSKPSRKRQDDRGSNGEFLLGLEYGIVQDLYASLGAGAGFLDGVGTPTWRMYGTLMYGARSGDEDGDGIPDHVDQCRLDPEDLDTFEDTDGCPDPDNDDDGVLDADDQCPDEREDPDMFWDQDGCPDPDNDMDGVHDDDDACQGEKEDMDGFRDGDGCPDPDNDDDRILDPDDTCPMEAEDYDTFQDDDGCPDPDNDDDGIPDYADCCPLEPEVKNDLNDTDGCPDLRITDKVFFPTNRWAVIGKNKDFLRDLGHRLRELPWLGKLHIEGHADERGSEKANERLGMRRARAVRDFLHRTGIIRANMVMKSFGETKPAKPNTTKKGMAENRRVELRIEEVDRCATRPPYPSPPPPPPPPRVKEPRLHTTPTNKATRPPQRPPKPAPSAKKPATWRPF